MCTGTLRGEGGRGVQVHYEEEEASVYGHMPLRCLRLADIGNDSRSLVEGQQHPRRYLGALAAKAKPDDLKSPFDRAAPVIVQPLLRPTVGDAPGGSGFFYNPAPCTETACANAMADAPAVTWTLIRQVAPPINTLKCPCTTPVYTPHVSMHHV